MNILKEAKKYSRLHKNNSEMKMFEPLRLIGELTAELESKNKEIERYEAVVEAAKEVKAQKPNVYGSTNETNSHEALVSLYEALSNLKKQDNE